jgi:hypothetical protein
MSELTLEEQLEQGEVEIPSVLPVLPPEASLAMPASGRAGSARASVCNDRSTRGSGGHRRV